jgi:hypothetical protein
MRRALQVVSGRPDLFGRSVEIDNVLLHPRDEGFRSLVTQREMFHFLLLPSLPVGTQAPSFDR